jgi:hypothetical protein
VTATYRRMDSTLAAHDLIQPVAAHLTWPAGCCSGPARDAPGPSWPSRSARRPAWPPGWPGTEVITAEPSGTTGRPSSWLTTPAIPSSPPTSWAAWPHY